MQSIIIQFKSVINWYNAFRFNIKGKYNSDNGKLAPLHIQRCLIEFFQVSNFNKVLRLSFEFKMERPIIRYLLPLSIVNLAFPP